MHDRTKRINTAIREAKERDNHMCRICGRGPRDGMELNGAHLLPRNVAFHWYRPDDVKWIVSLCRTHHNLFDVNKRPTSRADWLIRNGLREFGQLILDGMEGRLHVDKKRIKT